MLVASAKSLEEFAAEQLREDGSAKVLRKEGATGLLVPRGSTLTQTFVVAAGCYLCWEFRVEVRRFCFVLRPRNACLVIPEGQGHVASRSSHVLVKWTRKNRNPEEDDSYVLFVPTVPC